MMKVYLLFLIAIIVKCQANEESWSRQLNAYSGHRKNDLNQGTSLDEGGSRSDRSISSTAHDGSIYVVRTRGLNDDVRHAGDPSRGDNVRTPSTIVIGKLPTRSSQTPKAWRFSPNKGSDVATASGQPQGVLDKIHKATRAHKVENYPFVWNRGRIDDAASDGHVVRQTRSLPLEVSGVNQATFVSRTNNLGQGANVLRSSDLNRARSYGQENYLNRADALSQVDYKRRNLGSPVPIARAGNYLNNLDVVAQGLNVERTSYFDRSAPIVRAGNHRKENWIFKPIADVTNNEPRNDISISDSIRPEALMNRHGYSHPDSEIERKQRDLYVPSLLDIAEKSAIEDSNNNDHDSNMKDINLSSIVPNEDYSLFGDTYSNPNVGYNAPYDSYGINDGYEISNKGPNNGYGGLDYNMLAPDFDSFRDSDDKSITKNKMTNSTLIAAYDDSTDQNIYNNTDQKTIANRGGFFDDDNGYTVDHSGFHNKGTLYSDDSTMIDDIPDGVEISSNNTPMNSNGECYCFTNNGHRVCNCDSNNCQGVNCHRVTTQTQTATASCELCKAREATAPKPYVCDICTLPPPPPPRLPSRCDCHCEPCRQRESSCKCKQSCSCECNCCRSESSCCRHSNSSCCKHSCHSCKPNRPSCIKCESSQDFGNSYGDNYANNYFGESGINYYGENGNDHYRDYGNNAYNDYYNNYYKNQAATAFGGSAGGQFHDNVQGNAWSGAYAGESDQITGRGNSAIEQSDSSGVALYVDTDLDDGPISSSKSSNSGSSMSSVAGSSKIKSSGGISFKSSGGSVKTSGGKSTSSVSYSGNATYGGSPYKHLFSSFSKTSVFPNNPMMGPFG